jgi:2,3-bisphosphoglycerate-dependent phosphoglycerate mutase
MSADIRVVMVRHGESVYNEQNRFCGWYDADLATSGTEEAKRAGKVHVICHSCSGELVK